MLSIKKLTGSAAGIAGYIFQNEERKGERGYYREGESAPAYWQGRGAERLGLLGTEVDAEIFKDLLEFGPEGMKVNSNRRMGVDLTWSVPKGVSMLIQAAPPEQREQILQLCRDANAIVMQHIEDHVVKARYGEGGAVTKETGHAIIMTAEHDDTRPTPDGQGGMKVDMDTHFHNVLINATWDGQQWRSMDLDFGALSVEQHLADAKGKAYLAAGLEKMGIATVRDKKAVFEIAGITQEQRDVFSERSQQIEKALADKGLTRETATAAERSAANIETRQSKLRKETQQELKWAWRRRLRNAGVDFAQIQNASRDQTQQHTLSVEKEQHHGNEQEHFFQHEAEELHPARTELAADGDGLRNLSECRLDASQGRQGPGILPDHARADRSKDHDLRRKSAAGSAVASREDLARQAVDAALDHLSEKDSLFDRRQLHLEALKQGMGLVETDDIEKIMESHDRIIWAGEQAKEVEQKRPGKDGQEIVTKRMIRAEMVTTRETVHREGWIQGFVTEGRKKLEPVFQPDQAAETIKKAENAQGFSFSSDQRAALQDVLMSNDRVTAIIGGAGTGKTTVMKSLVDAARAQGYETVGLTPSHGARQELQEAGTDTNITTASFILGKQDDGGKPKFYILDEAGMVGDHTMQAVLSKMESKDRILLSGDPDQMKPVEAGDPLKTLEDKGLVHVSRLTEVRRQAKAEDRNLLALGQAWADRDTKKALGLIAQYVREVQPEATGKGRDGKPQITTTDRRKAIADATVTEYMGRSNEDRARTMIVSPTNEVRQMVNEKIRTELQERGELAADQVTVTQLRKAEISDTHRRQAEHYEIGQILRTQTGTKEERHTVDYEIVGIDAKSNQLKIAVNGIEKRIDAEELTGKKWQLFEKQDMGLAEGDKLIFRDNSVMKNGDAATVKNIEGNRITVRMDRDGEQVTIDAKRNIAADYGYGRTINDSQGKSPDLVIQTGEAAKNASRNLGLVGSTRMRYGYMLITDNKERTLKSFEKAADKNVAADARQKAEEAQDRRLDRLDQVLEQGKAAGGRAVDRQMHPEKFQRREKQEQKTREREMGMEM